MTRPSNEFECTAAERLGRAAGPVLIIQPVLPRGPLRCARFIGPEGSETGACAAQRRLRQRDHDLSREPSSLRGESGGGRVPLPSGAPAAPYLPSGIREGGRGCQCLQRLDNAERTGREPKATPSVTAGRDRQLYSPSVRMILCDPGSMPARRGVIPAAGCLTLRAGFAPPVFCGVAA